MPGSVMTRRTLAVLVAAFAALSAACSSDDAPQRAAGGSATAPSGDDAARRSAILPLVEGLKAEGDDRPVLSWTPVEGAGEYSVTVASAGSIDWLWVGTGTEVEYGTLPTAPGDEREESFDPDADLRPTLDGTSDHTWSVVAYGPSGDVLAMSAETPLAADEG